MSLSEYLSGLDTHGEDQEKWYDTLRHTVGRGEKIFRDSSPVRQKMLQDEVRNRIRTEELKAWYSSPEKGALFQGTSVSSLTIPAIYDNPLRLDGITQLEEEIAESYISMHDRHKDIVKDVILEKETVGEWIAEGLFYGLTLSSKIISQAFGLYVPHKDIIFQVQGREVDPHEILSYPPDIRKRYFEECRKKIGCFHDLDIKQSEFEESLVLADISKPKIDDYKNMLILGPPRCNEIAALISRHVTALVREKSEGRISPRSLMVTILDSDTPYTYHLINGYGHELAPVLPGLTVLGASGTIDAFRWLYAYRVSLITQKIMKGSLYSEVKSEFYPFVFFGVLVKRDADILLDLNNLGMLRYRRQISPFIEYCYLLPQLEQFLNQTEKRSSDKELNDRLF